MLNNIKSKNSGFTIVELLIVIVVIAILATITIVAFNGIQNRGKASAAESAVNTLVKKAEAANTLASSYPQDAADFEDNTESSLTGSGLTFVATAPAAAPTSPSTVMYVPCSGTDGTGAVITYWDYEGGTTTTKSIGEPTAAGTCTAGTVLPAQTY